MSAKPTLLLIGVVLLIFSLIFFWGGHKSDDQRSTWIRGEGTVLTSDEHLDSDDEGNISHSWLCKISYTRDDGSEWVKDDVWSYLPASEGDTVDIIYDPDSEAMECGDLPDTEDSEMLTEGATWLAVISGCCFIYIVVSTIKEKLRPAQANKE